MRQHAYISYPDAVADVHRTGQTLVMNETRVLHNESATYPLTMMPSLDQSQFTVESYLVMGIREG